MMSKIRHSYREMVAFSMLNKSGRRYHDASKQFVFRQLFDPVSSTFSYLICDVNSKEATIIDPVLEFAERDANLVKELGFQLKYAMNTHVHADHITGSGKLKNLVPGSKSVISKASQAMADIFLDDNDKFNVGNQELIALSTPGHTVGCLSYVWHQQKIVFTGDALLIRGCGRTDFQNGSSRKLYESIHGKLYKLPEEYKVFPAHDYRGFTSSTIGEEKKYNPRLTKTEEEFIVLMDELNLPYPNLIETAVPANRQCGLFQVHENCGN